MIDDPELDPDLDPGAAPRTRRGRWRDDHSDRLPSRPLESEADLADNPDAIDVASILEDLMELS